MPKRTERANNLPDNAVFPRDRAAWRAWLHDNHTRTEGVWLIHFKKSSGRVSLTYDAAVEEALCYGWVDSTARTVDDARTMLWFAPRRTGSGWASSNKARVATLIERGLMQPPGYAKIAAAQADGSWHALDSVEALEIPADLRAALRRHKGATGLFNAFPKSVRRGILQWIASAKLPETRARRVGETARLAAQNIRANSGERK